MSQVGRIPIVVLSDTVEKSGNAELIHEGADDYIEKPLDRQRFLVRLRAVLRRASEQKGDVAPATGPRKTRVRKTAKKVGSEGITPKPPRARKKVLPPIISEIEVGQQAPEVLD
jgi:DNA-binding response OmpR family regulator